MKKKTESFKLYDGVIITHKGEVTKLDYICELWDAFGWDIDANEEAKKCADIITRNLVGMGFCDLRANDGFPVHIEIIPPTN